MDHHNKYLVAGNDQKAVRQSRNGSSRKAWWLVEVVDNGIAAASTHLIRLKSCHGRYLTASNSPFLLGMTGNKVLQTQPENLRDMLIEWEPIRDGFQVKLRAFGGTFLRGNGGMQPWKNSVTHDIPLTGSTNQWILWTAAAVEVPQIQSSLSESLSSFSSFSDDSLGSPMSLHSTNSPTASIQRFDKVRSLFTCFIY
ncbi:hypothetical protein U1Q18_029239 [Sarracenia purpurea var. burkii]